MESWVKVVKVVQVILMLAAFGCGVLVHKAWGRR